MDSGVFERWQRAWQRAFADVTGVGLTAEQKADRLAVHQKRFFEKWKNELISYSPAVTFMLDRIKKETGVAVSPQDHTRCLPCDLTRSGGYAPALGTVRLCYGHFWSKKQMEHTFTHELVHIYDHCKFDTYCTNLRHRVCTEGNPLFQANLASSDKDAVERVVNEVWESCFNDTRPIDEASPALNGE
ncbi:hypothetical protein SCHPADRAFT_916587 [Schizopora paradoxa]|uniref:Mitochondrial inner membrane protease ATP23 n=1 Tax=Schizopora paradoxa TaxID=27342 RepID=A0A0H2RK06_9AGAM|nr:hypothetical protein SCHPADRAFT_916587 [Schizopora paradoxa]